VKLTDKQQNFVEEYLIDLNATQAAIRAGYSEKTARSQGQRLLTNVDIEKAIQKAMAERSKRTNINADNVLREIAHTAFDDIGNYLSFHPDADSPYGVRIDIKDSGEVDTRNISEVSIGKDGFKFKLYNKDSALVNLAKHLGLFDKSQEEQADIVDDWVQAMGEVDEKD
jgi:phage terminase small subunit